RAPEQPGFTSPSALPDRADGVNDEAGLQAKAGGEHCVTGSATADLPAGLEQLPPGGPVNRPIHTTATEKPAVRRVDDGVHVEGGDVCLDDLDHAQVDRVKTCP